MSAKIKSRFDPFLDLKNFETEVALPMKPVAAPPTSRADGLGQVGIAEAQELLERPERRAQVDREETDDDEQKPEREQAARGAPG